MMTVLLATRNGSRTLPATLEAMARVAIPEGGWKLVVIDNGSTDGSAKLARGFAAKLPLTVLEEPQPGKNAALNRGLDHLAGDLAVFTDDDVLPHPDWLRALRRTAEKQTDYTMFGGVVLPYWETPPPEWVQWIDLGPVYTLTGAGLQEGPLNPLLVFGPNMAIRSAVFAAGIRFDDSIGPRGASYAMGSETELTTRLASLGHRAWFAAEAKVEHIIRAFQLDPDWVLQRAIRFGRGRYRLNPSRKLWWGVPRHLFRDIPKAALRAAATGALGRRREAFQSRWHLNMLRGMAIEAGQMARTSGTASART